MNTDAPDVTGDYSGGDRGVSPALDAALDLLSNRRRRYVLYYLREQGGTVSLDELAEQVASWESDEDESPSVERVLADLHHCQLPRLDEAGAVSFDADDEYVSLDESTDAPLSEYLDLAAREENVV
jgi:hypothetical protein